MECVFVSSVEFMQQKANSLSKSQPQTCHRAFAWVTNMTIQLVNEMNTEKLFFSPHSLLAYEKAKLHEPQKTSSSMQMLTLTN